MCKTLGGKKTEKEKKQASRALRQPAMIPEQNTIKIK